MRLNSLAAALGLWASSGAWASVGKVSALEGRATVFRQQGGKAVALEVGAEIGLGDRLAVSQGHLKFELNDGSVIALGQGSALTISEAVFEGQERRLFSVFLKAGKLWAKVKKALVQSKFEVSTERAVAGVRGTVFRIDAETLIKGARGRKTVASLVQVSEGVVAVRPTESVARQSKPSGPKVGKGTRVQVPGPVEIGVEAWEKRYVELQRGGQIAVGLDLWEQSVVDAAAGKDAFAKWLEKNP